MVVLELIFEFIGSVVCDAIFAGIGKLYRWLTRSAADGPDGAQE